MKKLFLLLLTLACSTINGAIDSQEKLNFYKNNFAQIKGWLFLDFVDILIKLDQFQSENEIQGNLAEIGVYEGKLFILLYLLANNDDKVLAVDLFDRQDLNYDKSGFGCTFENFINNIKIYCHSDAPKLETILGDSSAMLAKDYIDKCKNNFKFRIFSIDGSHRPRETMIDLANAVESLVPGGIIIIDDFFNPEWPGVMDGVTQFLRENKTVKPFCIGFNKLLLTHPEFVEQYQTYLAKDFKPAKYVECFGSNVAILNALVQM